MVGRMDRVRVTYRKFDGSLHWNQPGWRLGEDEYGVWVGAPAGTPVRRGEEEVLPASVAHALLFPRDAWWTGMFNAAPRHTEIYCDITTVPHWPSPYEVTMIDLDLDVRRRRDGRVELLDEDEFAVHQVRYDYPPDVIEAAWASAEWLRGALREQVEPFGTSYLGWLKLAAGADALTAAPVTSPRGAPSAG